MTPGQVGLCTTSGFFGRLIRRVTRSRYNHSIISLGNGYNISAEPGGVTIHTDGYWPRVAWSHFDLTPTQQDAAVTFAIAQEGKPYAWFDDLLIGVALILRSHTPAWLQRKISSDGRWQCAELCDAALQAAGVHIFHDDRPVSAVYPGSFEPYWEAHGWV